MTRYLGAACSLPQPACLDVTWRSAGGILRFVANFGESAVAIELRAHDRALWTSPGATADRDRARLPPWTGLFPTMPAQ